MRLTITEVLQGAPGETWVVFSSGCGEGMARWADARKSADKARTYDVEFDIDIPMEASMISRDSPPPKAGFSRVGNETRVSGLLESIDEEGMGCLRIASDCLVLVETRLDASAVGNPLSIRLTPAQLRVFPYDL